MRKLRVSSAVLGLLLLSMVIFGMLVYYNYVGFGVYQQYKQVINFAAIASVMIIIVYTGTIAGRPNPKQEKEQEQAGAQTVHELEKDLLNTAKDYQRLMANSEDYHILTGSKGIKQKYPKNSMEHLKDKAMFDTDDFD